MQPSQSSANSMNCVVCSETTVQTTLLPCGHAHICLSCVSQMDGRQCPMCRAPIFKVMLPNHGGIDREIAFRDIRNYKERQDRLVISRTLQIIAFGGNDSHKFDIIKNLTSFYNGDLRTFGTRDILHSKFTSNAVYKGQAVRFEQNMASYPYEVPPTIIEDEFIDCVLICVPLNRIDVAETFMEWHSIFTIVTPVVFLWVLTESSGPNLRNHVMQALAQIRAAPYMNSNNVHFVNLVSNPHSSNPQHLGNMAVTEAAKMRNLTRTLENPAVVSSSMGQYTNVPNSEQQNSNQ